MNGPKLDFDAVMNLFKIGDKDKDGKTHIYRGSWKPVKKVTTWLGDWNGWGSQNLCLMATAERNLTVAERSIDKDKDRYIADSTNQSRSNHYLGDWTVRS